MKEVQELKEAVQKYTVSLNSKLNYGGDFDDEGAALLNAAVNLLKKLPDDAVTRSGVEPK